MTYPIHESFQTYHSAMGFGRGGAGNRTAKILKPSPPAVVITKPGSASSRSSTPIAQTMSSASSQNNGIHGSSSAYEIAPATIQLTRYPINPRPAPQYIIEHNGRRIITNTPPAGVQQVTTYGTGSHSTGRGGAGNMHGKQQMRRQQQQQQQQQPHPQANMVIGGPPHQQADEVDEQEEQSMYTLGDAVKARDQARRLAAAAAPPLTHPVVATGPVQHHPTFVSDGPAPVYHTGRGGSGNNSANRKARKEQQRQEKAAKKQAAAYAKMEKQQQRLQEQQLQYPYNQRLGTAATSISSAGVTSLDGIEGVVNGKSSLSIGGVSSEISATDGVAANGHVDGLAHAIGALHTSDQITANATPTSAPAAAPAPPAPAPTRVHAPSLTAAEASPSSTASSSGHATKSKRDWIKGLKRK